MSISYCLCAQISQKNNFWCVKSRDRKDIERTNLEYIYTFFAHIDEFEQTRADEEKMRQILFPTEINSMFGIAPVDYKVLPSTEALECLISKLIEEDKFEQLYIGNDNPYIESPIEIRTFQVDISIGVFICL